jgi:CubicO group peptidase (beta-lactamase class C family)
LNRRVKRFLSRATLRLPSRNGLGAFPVEENGLDGVGHVGWLAGYRSRAYADRETGTIIVVLANADTHSPVATAAQLLRIVGD